MKYSCPICQGELIHERVDDGITQHLITARGEIKEMANNSDGFDSIYCSIDKKHTISQELQEKIMDLIY